MNKSLFQQMLDYTVSLPVLKEWSEPQALLMRIATAKPADWLLPIHACEAVGGESDQAIPAMAAMGCLQLSIILIDDILDEDPRGEHQQIGVGSASNQALAFHAASNEAITHSHLSAASQLAVIRRLNHTTLKTAFGQHLDTQPSIISEAAYWQLVQTKSVPYFSLAFYLGAMFGNADVETADILAQVGAIYGEIIQIQDDMNDAMATPANPDWLQERLSLPILFASSVNHPQKDRFSQLQQQLPDPAALAEAQQILINCGAVSYCIDQILQRYTKAIDLSQHLKLAQPHYLNDLLEDVIQPVYAMFEDFGLPKPQGL